MTQIEVILILGVSALAVWSKDFFLYLIVGFSLLLYGYHFAETSWMEALPVLGLAGYMFYRSVRYWTG